MILHFYKFKHFSKILEIFKNGNDKDHLFCILYVFQKLEFIINRDANFEILSHYTVFDNSKGRSHESQVFVKFCYCWN